MQSEEVVVAVVVAVRLLDSDKQADGLWEMLYRWAGGDGWSDGLVKMADEHSDDDGQSGGRGKMVYRWLDGDRWCDGQIVGLVVGLTNGHVNDKLMGWRMDWSYDRWMGMTDRLAMQQTDELMDGHWRRQAYRQSGGVGEARWGCEATCSFRRVGGL